MLAFAPLPALAPEVAAVMAAFNKKDLKAKIAAEHPHVVKNNGPYWHKLNKPDLARMLVAAEASAARVAAQ